MIYKTMSSSKTSFKKIRFNLPLRRIGWRGEATIRSGRRRVFHNSRSAGSAAYGSLHGQSLSEAPLPVAPCAGIGATRQPSRPRRIWRGRCAGKRHFHRRPWRGCHRMRNGTIRTVRHGGWAATVSHWTARNRFFTQQQVFLREMAKLLHQVLKKKHIIRNRARTRLFNSSFKLFSTVFSYF